MDNAEFAIAADLAALGYKRWRFHYRFTHKIAHFQRQLRLAEKWQQRPGSVALVIARIRSIRCRHLALHMGAVIPPGVAGPGFSVAHMPGIVINETARIGRNCRIHQNVTIGSAHGESPTIGDNVWIGAGVVIVGDILVGDNSAIGANAVVVKNVPESCTVGGVPARIISNKSSSVVDGCALAMARN